MSVDFFIAVVLTHWLLTVAAGALVFIWSFFRRRFWPCIVLSVLAFLSSYYGVTRIRITSSQTVNGHLRYYIDSRWFFIASLVFSLLALAYTLWKRWRAPQVANHSPEPPPIAAASPQSRSTSQVGLGSLHDR